MSQREYNAIYRGPIIAFVNLEKAKQDAFIKMAPSFTRQNLKKAMESYAARGNVWTTINQ